MESNVPGIVLISVVVPVLRHPPSIADRISRHICEVNVVTTGSCMAVLSTVDVASENVVIVVNSVSVGVGVHSDAITGQYLRES
jgi:hypothetical protein